MNQEAAQQLINRQSQRIGQLTTQADALRIELDAALERADKAEARVRELEAQAETPEQGDAAAQAN